MIPNMNIFFSVSLYILLWSLYLLSSLPVSSSSLELLNITSSSYPTNQPTITPTPSGSLGYSWWYLTKSRCWLWGADISDETYSAIQYAFEFVLTDSLDDDQRIGTTIVTELVDVTDEILKRRRLLRGMESLFTDSVDHLISRDDSWRELAESDSESENMPTYDDDNSKKLIKVNVFAWTSTFDAANKVSIALRQSATEPMWIIQPIHEHGIREIRHAAVRDIVTIPTRSGPPDDYSGTGRISYIIFSTVFLYIAAGALIAWAVSCPRRHPRTLRTVQKVIHVSYRTALSAPVVVMAQVQAKLRGSQGFILARSDDEIDISESPTGTTRTSESVMPISSEVHEIELPVRLGEAAGVVNPLAQ